MPSFNYHDIYPHIQQAVVDEQMRGRRLQEFLDVNFNGEVYRYNTMTDDISLIQELSLGEKRANEAQWVAEFIRTGNVGEMIAVTARNHRIYFYSKYTIAGKKLLFTIDSERHVLRTTNSRTNHLMSLLTEVAQREGLELRTFNQMEELQGQSVTRHYRWRHPEEIDDSALMEEIATSLRPADDEQDYYDEEGSESPWSDTVTFTTGFSTILTDYDPF